MPYRCIYVVTPTDHMVFSSRISNNNTKTHKIRYWLDISLWLFVINMKSFIWLYRMIRPWTRVLMNNLDQIVCLSCESGKCSNNHLFGKHSIFQSKNIPPLTFHFRLPYSLVNVLVLGAWLCFNHKNVGGENRKLSFTLYCLKYLLYEYYRKYKP